MTNADVARIFEEIADLMEIQGQDGFRVNAYRRVARTIDDLPSQLTDIAARGKLADLPGVGKASAEKIQELLSTGQMTLHVELRSSVPAGLLELRAIPSLGPKKVALLWKECGVDSIENLSAAIAAGALDNLRGFGAKSIEKIKAGIEFLRSAAGRTRLGAAWEVAEAYRMALLKLVGVQRVEHAGSLRRGAETVGDLDLLCIADNGPVVVAAFTRLPGVIQVLASGDTKGSVLVERRAGRTIQVDLRVVPAESFGAAWQYFTGSKQHNVRLREMAVKRGWTLNEYALTDERTGKIIAAREEADIYAALGLPWMPPELREDRGEFELTQIPDDLLTLADIRGELHMHSTASDGRNSIQEMALAAKALGYQYICITDHSKSSVIANGLTPERLEQHIAAVRATDREVDGITILAGAEVDILSDGTLDYDDALLAKLDWVVASVHVGMGTDSVANTRRSLAAIKNHFVNVLAHPTGRLINKRDAMPLDIEQIARAAAANGTALEINASTYRLDLKDQHARLAADCGATISINCDAHSTLQFDQMRFGVLTARRARLRRGQVLNTWPLEKVREFVGAKRK